MDLLGLRSTAPAVGLFSSCMAALILSLALFIRDVNLSLRALRLEIGPPAEDVG